MVSHAHPHTPTNTRTHTPIPTYIHTHSPTDTPMHTHTHVHHTHTLPHTHTYTPTPTPTHTHPHPHSHPHPTPIHPRTLILTHTRTHTHARLTGSLLHADDVPERAGATDAHRDADGSRILYLRHVHRLVGARGLLPHPALRTLGEPRTHTRTLRYVPRLVGTSTGGHTGSSTASCPTNTW